MAATPPTFSIVVPAYNEAPVLRELHDRIRQNFHSAVRETFSTIWYPMESGLVSADFRMKFEGNRYSGERQVIDVLNEKMKFTEEVSGETFRKKKMQQATYEGVIEDWKE